MNENSIRSMPPDVRMAYMQPVDLLALLHTSVYSDAQLAAVRDRLSRMMAAKHGAASGPAQRAASNRKGHLKAIQRMVDDGGQAEMLPLLAQAMQSGLERWWSAQDWHGWADVEEWLEASRLVLSQRQLTWIAAQYARSVLDRTSGQNRVVCLRAIQAAETWASTPTAKNLSLADTVSRATYHYLYNSGPFRPEDPTAPGGDRSAYMAVRAAGNCANVSNLANSYLAANSARESMEDRTTSAGYRLLNDITKSLITPTLVSGDARSSGRTGIRSSALPLVMGAFFGAGAVHLAKRS